ncbi:MAG: glycosyltransferase family 39 protein [Alphaproteobacteria bacterium]|nr:glycosyltransferase family 39 protein [Alphaproteobacteria bacterium]
MRPDAQSWRSTSAGDIAERPQAASAPAFAWLAESSVILGLIGVYLLGHLALRLALSPTLGIDDAEQILFAQHWAFGYRFRQPPLFTWLLLPLIDLIGPGVLAISILRYTLLAITYVCLYLTARLCLTDQRLAGLAVLSFALIYVFAYYAHHDLTHTTALSAMVALALYVSARLARNPTWKAYGALGLVFGLGMLAKWNFSVLALGLPLTCLLFAGYRHLVLTRKILLTIAVMAVVVAPTALWMFAHEQSIQGVSSDILAKDGADGQVVLWLEGGGALLGSVLLFPLPFLLIFLALFGQSLRAGLNTAPPREQPALTSAFLGALTLIVLALLALLIPVFGAVNFTERWLHPALMGLPILLFALAERGRPVDRRIATYLAIIAILVAVAAGARLYRYSAGADDCGKCREFAPFAELADGLRALGFDRGTIVADGMHIGGNLKMLFADSRVIDPAFPRALWPAADAADAPGECLLVWRDDGENPGARRALIKDYAIEELGLAETAAPKTGRLDALLLGSSSRRYALGFELYRENAGGCR